MQFNTYTLLSVLSALTLAQGNEVVTVWETVDLTIDQMSTSTPCVINKASSNPIKSVISDVANFSHQEPTTLVTRTTTGDYLSDEETISTEVSVAAEVEPTTSTATTTSPASSDVHTGVATFYSVSADNCGTSSTDSDFVCAISKQLYDTLTNSQDISEYCGKTINVTYNSKTINVKVVDSCESCDANHLDLSPSAFNSLADPDLGVIDITWVWA